MGCTFIDAGSDHPEEIIRETRSGLYVRRLEAGLANPWSGTASFVVSDADLIEGGRITRALEPFMIELDVVEAMSSLDRIGVDLEFDTCIGTCVRDGQAMAVSVGAPTVRIGVIKLLI